MKDKKIIGVNREYWIDVIKAVGIIMVVLAHTLPKNNFVWIYINQFHMPLFFSISGYLYLCKGKWREYIKKKVVTLWLPYIACSYLMIVVTRIVELVTSVNTIRFSLKYYAKILFLLDLGPLLGATWFIQVLFYSVLAYDGVHRLLCSFSIEQKTKNTCMTIIALIALVIGVNTSLPCRSSVILNAFAFLHLGYLFKVKRSLLDKIHPVLAVMFLVAVGVISTFNVTSFASNTYTYKLLFICAAVAGTLGLIVLGKNYCGGNSITLRHMRYIGKNTMGIVIWQFISFKVVMLLQVITYHLPIERLHDYPVIYDSTTGIWVILYIGAGVYGSIIICKILTVLGQNIFFYKEKSKSVDL